MAIVYGSPEPVKLTAGGASGLADYDTPLISYRVLR